MSEFSTLDLMRNIELIANQDIPIPSNTPLYKVFYYRKEVTIKFLKGNYCGDERENILQLINHCNEQIKSYLAL